MIKNYIFLILLSLLSCTQKYPMKLGADYKLDYDGNSYFYLLDLQNTVIIGSHITQFNFDSLFIIIEQKPVELILKNTYNDPKINLKKRDEIFENNKLKLYWIINKNNSYLYGPYDKKQYFAKRKELNVPKSLQLKNNF